MACAADCSCETAVVAFAGCIGGGGDAITCGMPILGSGSPAGTALIGCVAGSNSPFPGGTGPGCLVPCGAGNLVGEAGTTEGGSGEGGAGEGGGEGGAGEGGGEGGEASTDAASGG
jgi:hypothetical protein